MSNSVRVFQSTDSGAPSLSGTAGTLIDVLDACLQNGYGEVTIDTLVVASDVATVTDSTGHGFTMLGNVGPVVRISGATPAGLNGDWRITVLSATQFTFATTGITDQTASGTIVAKRAPAGFTKEFSGTNLAAYRSDDVTGTRMYLRVNDTNASYATVQMFEAMSDINTGTGGSTVYYAGKDTGTLSRPWIVISDGRMLYWLLNVYLSNPASWLITGAFGDIESYRSGDAYSSLIVGAGDSGLNYGGSLKILNNAIYAQLARSYTQIGGAIASLFRSHYLSGSAAGSAGNPYPNPVDNGFHAWPIEVWEGSSLARGLMPGLWNPLHPASALSQGLVITDVPQLSEHTLWVRELSNDSAALAFDITGPWR